MSSRAFPTWPVRSLALLAAMGLAACLLVFGLHSEKSPTPNTLRSELTLQNGLWCWAGESKTFTGVMIDTYESGALKSRLEVSNGLLQGLSEGWFTNGQMQVREHFHLGLSHGLRTKWHENGRKLSEVMIVEGKLEGTFRRWNQDGVLFEEIELANGKAEGLSRGYYPSGYLRTEARLHDGEVLDQKFWKDGEQEGAPLAAIGGK